ncbi:MAG: hypothetical protein LBS11_11910 [Oscillospiraceae bacterium]|jgi:hypothetical protein|nr:hypothetical protein [Oscillospiraceae bacterium]
MKRRNPARLAGLVVGFTLAAALAAAAMYALWYVNDYLGLYNATAFSFRLGEVVFVLFLLALLFIGPALAARPLLPRRKALPRRVRLALGGVTLSIGAACAFIIHEGFFNVLSDFLYYCGITGGAAEYGRIALQGVISLSLAAPGLIMLFRKSKQTVKEESA